MIKAMAEFCLSRLPKPVVIGLIKERLAKDWPSLTEEQKKELFDMILKYGSIAATLYLQSLAQKQ